jgi:hypothetical protein
MAKSTRKNYFNIHSLIAKGINDVRKYQLPVGEVLYRPISQLEAEEAQAIMIGSIQDIPTREYLFSLAEKNELDKANEVLDQEENASQFPPEVNLAELYKAMINHAIHVCYLAMIDFTDDFNENDLKKLDGIREFADEIMKISGQDKETLEEVESFPEQL